MTTSYPLTGLEGLVSDEKLKAINEADPDYEEDYNEWAEERYHDRVASAEYGEYNYEKEISYATNTYHPETQILVRPVTDAALESKFAETFAAFNLITLKYANDDTEWLAQNKSTLIDLFWVVLAAFENNDAKIRKIAALFVFFEMVFSTPICFFKDAPRLADAIRGRLTSFPAQDARLTDVCRTWSAKFEALIA